MLRFFVSFLKHLEFLNSHCFKNGAYFRCCWRKLNEFITGLPKLKSIDKMCSKSLFHGFPLNRQEQMPVLFYHRFNARLCFMSV